jgi:hypothetical protein
MNVQQSRSRGLDTTAQRVFDMLQVVQAFGTDQIHEEMSAGKAHAILLAEKISRFLPRGLGAGCVCFFRLGGA